MSATLESLTDIFLECFRPAGINQVMDAARLAELLERHGPALTLYARQWSVAPEDCVQEAFVALARQTALPDPVAPWLFRVVRNAALAAARSDRRRKHHEARAAERQRAWFVPVDDAQIDGATVTAWLQTLPADQREVITMHLWGGLSFADIGEVMDASASSAFRWYQAGLESLRGRITCLKD